MKILAYDRRDFLKTIGIGASSLALSQIGFGCTNSAAKPNVLFIAVDDLNDWIGCMDGHPNGRTPNIDRLAAEGTLFERAYCSAPLCNPSRVSLLTGLRPSTTGIYGNRHSIIDNIKDTQPLTKQFMENGYYVLGGGKIFHRGKYTGGDVDKNWWHEYFKRQGDPKPKEGNKDVVRNPFGFGPIDVDDDSMADMKLANWAVEQLGREYDRPFFLGVGIFKPHLVWFVPRKYFDMHPLEQIELIDIRDDDLDDVPPVGRRFAIEGIGFRGPEGGDHKMIMENGHRLRATQAYLATSTFADACVGRVLDALYESPYADNTIVVLWGDHGWHLGEKLHWRKHALWEETTRMPLIIYAPGVTKKGTKCQRTISLLDLYPTLMDLCGLPKPEFLEGESLMPLLKNPEEKWDCPALTTFGKDNHAVRSERWRYIRYFDGGEELYDHENDPMEWINLAGKKEYDNIKKEMTKWLPKINAPDTSQLSEFKVLLSPQKSK